MTFSCTVRQSFVVAALALIACGVSVRAADPELDCAHDDVTLTQESWSDAEKLIAGQQGKVVLVDIWTTTCPTCVEHFPEYVALHRQWQERGLVAVSVNCDHDGVPGKPPEHYAPRVLEFLKKQDARFTNVLLTDPLVDFLDAAGIDATPTYLLYGRDGKLVRRFDGSAEEFTFEQVAQAVESAMSTACGGGKSQVNN